MTLRIEQTSDGQITTLRLIGHFQSEHLTAVTEQIVATTFPLAEAAEALRYLVEGRPFGRVVLTI